MQKFLRWSTKGGIDQPQKPHKMFFNSWISDAEALEMIHWASKHLTEGSYYHHPRAHTWNFSTRAQFDAFTGHRPMRKGRSKPLVPIRPHDLVKLYPWPKSQTVALNMAKATRKVEPIYADFSRDIIDDWAVENSRGRVTQSCPLDDESVLSTIVNYEFEFPEDALLFKVRWG